MNRVAFGAILIAGVLSAVPAGAADLITNPAPFAPSTYRWAGGYAGLNLGYQWGTVTNATSIKPSGFNGGLQGGYLWQNGQFVFGGEADLQLSGADDSFGGTKFYNTWFGTVRGRGGMSMNNILVYLTAGIAFGGSKAEIGTTSETQSHIGWTAGLGIEVGLTPNWSAKAEYLYVDLADKNYVLTGAANGIESNMLRMGVNYRF